jgi:hypothetical protein
MPPRNLAAFNRAARIRQRIRALMLARASECPLGRPLTAKTVQTLLRSEHVRIGLSTVAKHIAAVRLEDELRAFAKEAEKREKCSNLSDTTAPVS